MSTKRVRIDPDDPQSLPEGRIDHAVLDGATEADLASQQRQDDAEAMRDMARAAFAGAWGLRRWSSRGVSTCRTRRSATGNRASAAPPAPPEPCSGFSTRRPRRLCGC